MKKSETKDEYRMKKYKRGQNITEENKTEQN